MNPLPRTRSAFASAFGAPAALSVQAPGRVNLIGEHTDYNDGFVLPCAIDYQTVICGSPRSDRRVRVMAVDYAGELDEFALDEAIEPRGDRLWANYVRGVVKCLRDAGHQLGGADLAISGNVPQGAGLSSSALARSCHRDSSSRHRAGWPSRRPNWRASASAPKTTSSAATAESWIN